MMKRERSLVFLWPRLAMAAGLLLASGAVACGGAAAGGAPPQAAVGAAPLGDGAGAVDGPNAVGPQYAISDAPTSGQAAAPRPKMNAAATQAYGAGMQAFAAGDLEGARTQFQRATEADAKAYQAWYSLGVVRERLGDRSGAQTAYRKAVAAVRDYEPAIVALAVLLARSGQLEEAESFLTEKQAQIPRSAAVFGALAEVKSIRGDSGEAQRLAQEALKRNPDYRPAMVTLARDHYRNRRLDLALYALRGILDGYGPENPPRDKNNAEARLLRGLIYKEQGHRQEAIGEFQSAIQLRPDLVEARIHLAAYLLEAGNATEAAQLLEGAMRYDRGNVLVQLNLGDAYRLLGKAGEARERLQWVVSRDSSLAQAHYNLGLLYLFSEQIPGVTPRQAAELAVSEFELYKQKRSRKQGDAPDDTEELITRAKAKKAMMEAEAQPAAPAPAAAAPAAAADAAPASGEGGTK